MIDRGTLKKIINETILNPCDHKNLNLEVPFLEGLNPTTENLARAFYYELEEAVNSSASESSFLYSVRVLETARNSRSEEHTSELQSRGHLVCRLLLEKKKKNR